METQKQKKQRTPSQDAAMKERMIKLRELQAAKRAERKAKGEEPAPRKKKENAEVKLIISERQLRDALKQVRKQKQQKTELVIEQPTTTE